MILSEAEFHEASTLERASELMGCWGAQAQLLAGGTNLLVDLKTDRFRTDHVISINRIAALRGISGADGGVRIGALTTINQLAASPRLPQNEAKPPACVHTTRTAAGPCRLDAAESRSLIEKHPSGRNK